MVFQVVAAVGQGVGAVCFCFGPEGTNAVAAVEVGLFQSGNAAIVLKANQFVSGAVPHI